MSDQEYNDQEYNALINELNNVRKEMAEKVKAVKTKIIDYLKSKGRDTDKIIGISTKPKTTCDCGCTVNSSYFNRHVQSKKHKKLMNQEQEQVEISKATKTKTRVECVCGCLIMPGHLKKHMTGKQHMNAMLKIGRVENKLKDNQTLLLNDMAHVPTQLYIEQAIPKILRMCVPAKGYKADYIKMGRVENNEPILDVTAQDLNISEHQVNAAIEKMMKNTLNQYELVVTFQNQNDLKARVNGKHYVILTKSRDLYVTLYKPVQEVEHVPVPSVVQVPSDVQGQQVTERLPSQLPADGEPEQESEDEEDEEEDKERILQEVLTKKYKGVLVSTYENQYFLINCLAATIRDFYKSSELKTAIKDTLDEYLETYPLN